MTIVDTLITEFEHEGRGTRRLLERLPDDRLDWRPHEKSSTAGMLASHIVDCLNWTPSIFGRDELVIDPATFRPYQAASVGDLLTTLGRAIAGGMQALAGVTDNALLQPWRLVMMGRVRFEKPRILVFRDFTMSHLAHHRGQFSVYLRLMGIPVPGAYGPSADEA